MGILVKDDIGWLVGRKKYKDKKASLSMVSLQAKDVIALYSYQSGTSMYRIRSRNSCRDRPLQIHQ
jgi:hypothetical protein